LSSKSTILLADAHNFIDMTDAKVLLTDAEDVFDLRR
jgi:hypothetical protein